MVTIIITKMSSNTHPVIQALWDAMPPEGTPMYHFYENGVTTLEGMTTVAQNPKEMLICIVFPKEN